MEIINTIRSNGTDAVRLFSSLPEPRTNSMRIHYHSMIELSLIRRGHGLYRTSAKEYHIKPGDIFFYRPNEPHCITDIEQAGMELLNLHIAPYYLYTNLQNSLTSEYLRILSAQFSLDSNRINDFLPADQLEEVGGLMCRIHREMTGMQRDYIIYTNNCISAIMITLSRALQGGNHPAIAKQNAYQRIAAAIAYMDANFREDITLEKIASHIGYSRCYFSTVFRQCMGMTPWDYISIKRIEEALTLIKTTNHSILEIATACGFNNTANFCRLFKKYTNLMPSSFRS